MASFGRLNFRGFASWNSCRFCGQRTLGWWSRVLGEWNKREARMEGYCERRLFEHTRIEFGEGPARPMPSTRQSSRPNGSSKQIQSSP